MLQTCKPLNEISFVHNFEIGTTNVISSDLQKFPSFKIPNPCLCFSGPLVEIKAEPGVNIKSKYGVPTNMFTSE